MTLPTLPTLRPYQLAAVAKVQQAIAAGHRRILLVAPTGAGKTTIAASLIDAARARGESSAYVAHRTELIEQASARLDMFGVPHGVLAASTSKRADPEAPVQVASIQTITSRSAPPPASVLILDEAHRTMGASYMALLDGLADAVVIGLTATPARLDGQPLSQVYTAMIEAARIDELVDAGVLLRPRVYAMPAPSLAGVRTHDGDYVEEQLGDVMDQAALVEMIVATWIRRSGGCRTVVFASSVEHSSHIAAAFVRAGVPAEHLDAHTPDAERTAILGRLADGETLIVCNVGVLAEGWDCPAVACVVLARPTRSTVLYLQMIGRGVRAHPGKAGAVVLDHAGCTVFHGHPTEPREWSLAMVHPRVRYTVPAVAVCSSCYLVKVAGVVACVGCGEASAAGAPGGRIIRVGGLVLNVAPGMSLGWDLRNPDKVWQAYLPPIRRALTESEAREFFDGLALAALRRGHSAGWPAAKFRELIGVWPSDRVRLASSYADRLRLAAASAS